VGTGRGAIATAFGAFNGSALCCPRRRHHLAELRDLGVITSEEFEIMKARIVHGG
jgi:hypothetical protein